MSLSFPNKSNQVESMGITLRDLTVKLTGEEQYVLACILQSAKGQMEAWHKAGKAVYAPASYAVVCTILKKIDPEIPPKEAEL